MEVLGVMTLRISEGEFSKIVLNFANDEDRNIQFQVCGTYMYMYCYAFSLCVCLFVYVCVCVHVVFG